MSVSSTTQSIKKTDFNAFNIGNRNFPFELPKSGHRYINLCKVAHSLPQPHTHTHNSTNILGISSMILVLSTMHISEMVLERKKSYKPEC